MDVGFIGDNVAQLHKGNTCFIYIEDQIKPIIQGLKKKFGEKAVVEKVGDYWVLRKPIEHRKKGKNND